MYIYNIIFLHKSIILSDNLPAFGPSHLYFYECFNNQIYFGKLLISIETEIIDDKLLNQIIPKQDILHQLNEFDYWATENFRVNLMLINMDCLLMQVDYIKIYLNCEDIFSNQIEIQAKDYSDNAKVKYVKFISNTRPMVALTIKLPDNRLKHQIVNILVRIVREMVNNIYIFLKMFKNRFNTSGRDDR